MEAWWQNDKMIQGSVLDLVCDQVFSERDGGLVARER